MAQKPEGRRTAKTKRVHKNQASKHMGKKTKIPDSCKLPSKKRRK